MGGAKVGTVGLTQVQRHGLAALQRPVATTAAGNSNKTSATSPPKPRPPPTASPLIPPHKSLSSPMATPQNLHKPGNNSSNISRIGASGTTTPSSQSHSTVLPISSSSFSSSASSSSAASHLNAKTQPKIPSSPSPSQPKPQQHQHQQQSTFVTPMQATLTKSPHSSNSPILKLTPRVTPVSSPSPAHSRASTLPNMHQFSPKTAGFHAGFSGAGYSTPVGQPKTPSQVNSSGLTSTSTPITKHTTTSAGSANHGPRQRPAGVANQVAKPMLTVSSATAPQLAQVSSSSASLLGPGAPNLPLNFGMLGGITPVSLPFAFPSLLNLPTVTGTSAGANTANQSSSGYSLQPNVNQSQSGDLKRKL